MSTNAPIGNVDENSELEELWTHLLNQRMIDPVQRTRADATRADAMLARRSALKMYAAICSPTDGGWEARVVQCLPDFFRASQQLREIREGTGAAGNCFEMWLSLLSDSIADSPIGLVMRFHFELQDWVWADVLCGETISEGTIQESLKHIAEHRADVQQMSAPDVTESAIERQILAVKIAERRPPDEQTRLLAQFQLPASTSSNPAETEKVVGAAAFRKTGEPEDPDSSERREWTFRPGEAEFAGHRIEISGLHWRLLKVLAKSKYAVKRAELKDTASPEIGIEDGTLRGYLSEIRRLLRTEFGTTADPIPHVDTRELSAWRLDSSVLRPA